VILTAHELSIRATVASKMETLSSEFEDLTLLMKLTFGIMSGRASSTYLPQKLIVPSLVMFRYMRVIDSF
jgi:hypothetical protein